MKIKILGNNSAVFAHERHPSAQIVEIRDEVILIDCGEGTQMQLQKYGIKRSKINHIFISHLHGDHYFGLIGLLTSLALNNRQDQLCLYGPEALLSIINIQLSASNSCLPYPLIFTPIPDDAEVITLLDNVNIKVETFAVEHRIPTHGFLIESKSRGRKINPEACRAHGIPTGFYNYLKLGEDYTKRDGTLVKNEELTNDAKPSIRYAYCADTRYIETFINVIKNVDVMYHESTYLDTELALANERYHSTAKQAATIAQKATVKQLLLGHYSSRYKEVLCFENEAKEIFSNTIATVEGMEFEF